MMNETGPVRLTKSSAREASEVMARAFMDYPMMTYYFPEEKSRLKFNRAFIAIAVNVCLKYGELYAFSPALEGVAGWLPPGNIPLTMGRMFRAVPLGTLLAFAASGATRLRDISHFIEEMHRKAAPFPHWYLQVIGVAPEHQGKGYSGRLLRPMLERLDREGMPCFLETEEEKNSEIYQHFGFRVVYREKVPGTELTSWGMLYEPHG